MSLFRLLGGTMRTERLDGFARLETLLLNHEIRDPAWATLKELESNVGNITSEQIDLIAQLLVDQTITALKKQMINTIEKL
jgi:hypothetical protein